MKILKKIIFKNINLEFPFLFLKKNKKITYLDNAATTYKSKEVLYSEINFYKKNNLFINDNLNINFLNLHFLEQVREKIKFFINCKTKKEIIFVKNSTEGINFIANTWGNDNINENDNIIISQMEHHSNIIPWILLCKKKKCFLKIIKIKKNFLLNIKNIYNLIDKNTKLISITHISNVLGTINPIKKIIKIIKSINKNIKIFIDGSQAISKIKIDIINLNCDFYTFSAHKMYGPTGIGILYIKQKIMKTLFPFIIGGGSIKNLILNKNKMKFSPIPWKFEYGTQNFNGIIFLNSSIDYLLKKSIKKIKLHNKLLSTYCINKLLKIKNLKIYGNIKHIIKTGIISFNIENINAIDLSLYLKEYNIFIRSGHLCSIPLIKNLKLNNINRISIGIYNTYKDIDYLIKIIKEYIKNII